MAQLAGASSCKLKGCGKVVELNDLLSGHVQEATNQCFLFLSHTDVSFSLSLSLSLKAILKMPLEDDKKKKEILG